MNNEIRYSSFPISICIHACGIHNGVYAWMPRKRNGPMSRLPPSVHDIMDVLERGWRSAVRVRARFPGRAERIEAWHPFFSDSRLTLKARTYYFDREKRDEDLRSRAWAIGGSVEYRSGWWRDIPPSVRNCTIPRNYMAKAMNPARCCCLHPVQEGYTILGRAYAHLRHGDQNAVLRQTLDLPYVNKQDIRLTPNTFEAYTLSGSVNGGPYVKHIYYTAGYVDKMKKRNADSFIDMADAAGVTGRERGLIMTGARFQFTDHFTLGGINHYVDDIINIGYAATDFTYDLTYEVGIRLEGQFTHQSSVGDDLLTGEDFDTWNLGGRAAVSYRGLILKVAFSTTDDEARIRSPYGSYPGYLSLMQKDFNRADEGGCLVGRGLL